MADLTPHSSFDNVYQLERTDVVDAGVGGAGTANRQAQQLLNRTEYLKDALEQLDESLGSAAEADADDFATAEQGEKAESAVQPEDLIETQTLITEDTQLTNEHTGILFCASDNPLLITAPDRESVPDGWQVTLIQAGAGRVRIDGAGLAADGNNCLTKRGTGATLAALDAAITASVAEDFWLAGALTEHRESLLLESGSALSLENNQPLELEV